MQKQANLLLIVLTVLVFAGCSTTGALSGSDSPRDGSSFEKAVIVQSVRAEYLWVDRHYRGSNLQSQVVTEYNGRPYDIITITTREGAEREVYFDIAKFYKK